MAFNYSNTPKILSLIIAALLVSVALCDTTNIACDIEKVNFYFSYFNSRVAVEGDFSARDLSVIGTYYVYPSSVKFEQELKLVPEGIRKTLRSGDYLFRLLIGTNVDLGYLKSFYTSNHLENFYYATVLTNGKNETRVYLKTRCADDKWEPHAVTFHHVCDIEKSMRHKTSTMTIGKRAGSNINCSFVEEGVENEKTGETEFTCSGRKIGNGKWLTFNGAVIAPKDSGKLIFIESARFICDEGYGLKNDESGKVESEIGFVVCHERDFVIPTCLEVNVFPFKDMKLLIVTIVYGMCFLMLGIVAEIAKYTFRFGCCRCGGCENGGEDDEAIDTEPFNAFDYTDGEQRKRPDSAEEEKEIEKVVCDKDSNKDSSLHSDSDKEGEEDINEEEWKTVFYYA